MLSPTISEPRIADEHDDLSEVNVTHRTPVSRRGFGRHLLGASAIAVLFAMGKRDEVVAAPLTDTWKLGGNNGVNTDGTNFLGTINVAPLIFKTASISGSPQERMRILANGNVGIGVSSPSAKLQVKTGITTALLVETTATAAGATSVLGRLTSTAPGSDAAGVRGVNNGTNSNGAGVRGSHAGGGSGVHGTSTSGYGVQGASTSGYGVFGSGGYNGVYASGGSYGLIAYGNNTGSTGAYARGSQYGVAAYANSLTGYAGFFWNLAGSSTSTTGVGVQGLGSGGSDSLVHPSGGFYDAGGEFSGPNGIIGAAAHVNGYGVIGIQGPGTLAMYAYGNMVVSGTFSAGGTKNFEIDHPLDPANKTLKHAAVESSDVKNMYDGVVTLDANGTAVVTLPPWMEALNKDFRYQLTTIGEYAPVYISEKITNNQFKIAGGTPGMEVSWLVTGIRNDKYMQQHPMEVESEKQGDNRGKYLAPELFGQSSAKGIGPQAQQRGKRPAPVAPVRP